MYFKLIKQNFFACLILISLVSLTPRFVFAQQELEISIEDAEVIALTNNIILSSLKDRKEIFRMVATEKWRNYLPRVGVSYFGLKNNNINQPDSQYNDIRLQLNQLVYDGGENSLEIESAKLQELLNNEDWNITKAKIQLETRRAYIRLIASEIKSKLSVAAFERAKKARSDLGLEVDEGFASKTQWFEVENKIREIELLVLKSESMIRLNEIELKKQMNLPLETKLILKDSLLGDFVIYNPPKLKDLGEFIPNKPEFKKAKLSIENLKTRQEIAESYWKPKVVLGGYYGQNINGPLPVRNEVFGFNIGLQTQLGSTTNQSNVSSGVQSDGTGIQRIPGYGPQFVGKGENAFNSSTFNFFDDLSYSRKIYENKISLSDAIRNKRFLEISIEADILKSLEKMNESWQLLRVNNLRFYQVADLWKTSSLKLSLGYVKLSEHLSAELDLLRALDEVSISIGGYLENSFELAYATGVNPDELILFKKQKGGGNSIFNELLKAGYFEKSSSN